MIVSDGGIWCHNKDFSGHNDKTLEHTSQTRQTIGLGRTGAAAAAENAVFLDADVHIFNPDNFWASVSAFYNPKLVGLGGLECLKNGT